MKTVDQQGGAGRVVMNQPAYDEDTGKDYLENDLSDADFDVVVDVGPSSSSRRAATVRALTGMMQLTQDPETAQVLSGLAMMNMEGEGIGDVREYFRTKMLRMGAVKPTEEEQRKMAEEQAQAGPSAQDQALLGMAEEAQANAAQARATTVQRIADADLKAAQRIATLAKAGADAQQAMIASVEMLQQALQPAPIPAPAFDTPAPLA
jgi:hypothetical protein